MTKLLAELTLIEILIVRYLAEQNRLSKEEKITDLKRIHNHIIFWNL
jgi:hypothetical protein